MSKPDFTYQELCEQYPGREVRLVLDNYVDTYESLGYQTIQHGIQKSECDSRFDVGYWFMVSPERKAYESV